MKYLLAAAAVQVALAAAACSGVDQEYVHGQVQPLQADLAELQAHVAAQDQQLADDVEALEATTAAAATALASTDDDLSDEDRRLSARIDVHDEAIARIVDDYEARLAALEAERVRLSNALAVERARVAALQDGLGDLTGGFDAQIESRLSVYYYAFVNDFCAILPGDLITRICERDPAGGWRFRRP